MTFDRQVSPFSVIVVPFPYSDRLAEKRRPALVVSSEALHRGAGTVWIAMITGAGKEARRGDVLIGDLEAAGLSGPSIIRLSKLATIEPTRVVRTIGRLSAEQRPIVAAHLAEFLTRP